MKRKLIGLIVVLTLVIVVGGVIALFQMGKKDLVFSPMEDKGHFSAKMDAVGRVTEIRVFDADKKLKLRTLISYDTGKRTINEVMIYDGEGNLVEGHLMQNGGHSIGPQPPVPNPPFKLSFAGEGGIREWRFDGQPLLREEQSESAYTVSGPDGVVLFTRSASAINLSRNDSVHSLGAQPPGR